MAKSDLKKTMIKKRNPIAKTLPEFRHKRFKDKTKYNRKKLNSLSLKSSLDNE